VKALLGIAAAFATAVTSLALLAVVLGSSPNATTCLGGSLSAPPAPAGGAWIATAYGPPWGGIEGNGVTATGMDLTSGARALEVAVDPSAIPLRSYVHVQPNPFGSRGAFYAGDTGGAIIGHHVDIYDWRGRASQDAWGQRSVSVTRAPSPGSGNLLGAVPPTGPVGGSETPACQPDDGSIGLTPGQTARVLPDGTAAAPQESPPTVRRALTAGNLIHTRPYPEPTDVHYGTLATLWPAYDCSGATSFVLYGAGLMGPDALDSTGLESYGLPGPGRWITIYANSAHAWIVVAGIALDTAGYGGPAIPGGSGPRWRSDPLANLRDGSAYVARHPPGL
jgi:3D (Asp-Asp-Asp) domain-containing protein